MKQLNAQNIFNDLPKTGCKPETKKMEIQGKNFVLDINSLALYELSSKEKEIELEGAKEVCFFPANQDQASKHIVFQATYACNYNCRYCFVMKHYCDHTNTMTEQEHYEALAKFQPFGPYRMGWFGGEPFLNWEIIYRVSQKVIGRSKQENRGKPSFHITTNGSLITEEIANYCVANDFSFIVSLDGPKHIHDNNRPYEDGRGTFDDSFRGLTYLANAYKKQGKPNQVTLRGTFDTMNPQILESTKFLNELMYAGFAGHVSVEPSTLGEGCGSKSRIDALRPEEIRAIFVPQYEATCKWFVDEIKQGRHPSLHQIEMSLQRLYDREHFANECGAGLGYISVGPGGKICACHREHRTEIGNMQEGGINPAKQAKWLDNRLYNRNLCPTCWKRWICGGGCRCNSLLVNNRINEPSIAECVFNEIRLRCAIWILSELSEKERKTYSKKAQEYSVSMNGPFAIWNKQSMQNPQMQMAQMQKQQQPKQCNDPNCKCHEKKKQCAIPETKQEAISVKEVQ